VSEFFMNPNRLRSSYIKDLMTAPVMGISPFFDLFQANRLMLEHNFRRLPVVHKNNVVGMLTQTDVAKGLYEFIERKKDAACKPAKDEKAPVYCMKKSINVIVCERAVPINVTGDSGDENDDEIRASQRVTEKVAEKTIEKPGAEIAAKSQEKTTKKSGKKILNRLKNLTKPQTGKKVKSSEKNRKAKKKK